MRDISEFPVVPVTRKNIDDLATGVGLKLTAKSRAVRLVIHFLMESACRTNKLVEKPGGLAGSILVL